MLKYNAICRGRRSGLTLLEVLVAATLMAALLVALWRLIGIYTSLREKGDVHAEWVSDVSVMTQQLEDDLRNLSSEGLWAVPGELAAHPREAPARECNL